MAFLSLLLGVVLGAGAIVFALQNNTIVALTFINWQFQSSLAVVILLTLIIGFILGVLLSVPSILSRSFVIMGLKRQRKDLAKEADALRQQNAAISARAEALKEPESPAVVDLRQ